MRSCGCRACMLRRVLCRWCVGSDRCALRRVAAAGTQKLLLVGACRRWQAAARCVVAAGCASSFVRASGRPLCRAGSWCRIRHRGTLEACSEAVRRRSVAAHAQADTGVTQFCLVSVSRIVESSPRAMTAPGVVLKLVEFQQHPGHCKQCMVRLATGRLLGTCSR